MTECFYSHLSSIHELRQISNPLNYHPMPDDWLIVSSDIVNSTAAVAAGDYQAVNFLGAACIAAVLNLAGDIKVPFIFGGDGATLAIPPSMQAAVRCALQGIQQRAAATYGLTLRVALIPVSVLRRDEADLLVGKLQVSPHYDQALFRGGGARLADKMLKGANGPYHLVPVSGCPPVDLAGLECRWQEVAIPEREVVTLLVMACATASWQQQAQDAEILRTIATIYDLTQPPIPTASLRMNLAPHRFKLEACFKAAPGVWKRWSYQLRIWLQNLLGWGLVAFKLRTAETDWAQYPAMVQANLDYRKYEDGLRLVLVGTATQRARLETYLDTAYNQGTLLYGLHTSNRAVLTCLVYARMGRQVHFVDGADGGYACAAQQLKHRPRLHDQAIMDVPPSTKLSG